MKSYSEWVRCGAGALLPLLVVGSPAWGAEASRGEHRLLVSHDLVMLAVENPFGRLEVIGEDREDLALEVQYRVHARSGESARSLVAALSVELSDRDGWLRLQPAHDGRPLNGGSDKALRGAKLRLDLLLRAPAGLGLHAGVTGESLVVSGLTGDARLSATSGDIELSELGGAVDLTLTSGNVRGRDLGGPVKAIATSGNLEFNRVETDAELHSSTGWIRSHDIAGDLHIESLTGDIRVDGVDGDLRVISTSGDLDIRGTMGDVRVNSAGGTVSLFTLGPVPEGRERRVRITSSSGDVILGLRPDAGYHLDLATDMGAIRVRLPLVVEDITRRHLAGRMGDGRGQLQVVTATGDIRISLAE